MSLSGTQAQSILLAVLLATAAIPPASVGADATPATGDETTFHVTQGSECYEIAAHGNGTTSVEDFYDYRTPDTEPSGYTYSSHGTRDLQANQVSNLFLYHGTEGYSLVMLHDELGDAPYGSTVTFEISGLPTDREWAVEDDDYDGRDDNYDHGSTNSTIDWMWSSDRTDGAAVRGLGGDDYEAVIIDPAFNENASAWGDWSHSGGDHRIRDWRLLDADGSNVSLAMDRPVSVAVGGCDDDGTTTTTTENETTTETSTTTTTETTTETTNTTTEEDGNESETTTQTTTEDETTNTTTETTSTTTTTETTTTETTTTTDDSSGGDDSSSNDGDGSSEQAYEDDDSESSQSGGVQGVAGSQSSNEEDPEPSRATENLSDEDGRFGNVTLETNASDATLVVETDGPPPDDVRAPTTERDGFETLSYVHVGAEGTTATTATATTGTDGAAATVTVTLSTDRLEALAASPGNASLFRVENGSWTEVSTERVDGANETGGANGPVGLRANVTNGTYAVGVDRPVIGVTDLTIDATQVTVGESVSAVVTVENEGRANGTRTVQFAIDGEVVDTRNVSVSAGGTREVVFTHQFDAAGPREVGVGEEDETVVVESVETTAVGTTATADPATTDATVSTTPATNDSGASVPGFGVIAALVALAGAALFSIRRG
jgi:PGF-CTERM protein